MISYELQGVKRKNFAHPTVPIGWMEYSEKYCFPVLPDSREYSHSYLWTQSSVWGVWWKRFPQSFVSSHNPLLFWYSSWSLEVKLKFKASVLKGCLNCLRPDMSWHKSSCRPDDSWLLFIIWVFKTYTKFSINMILKYNFILPFEVL